MGTILRLFTFVKPYWWASVGSLTLIVAVTFFRMAPALLTKPIVDDAIPKQDTGMVLMYVLMFVGASLLGNLLSATELYAEQFVGQKVIYDIRNYLYRHLQSQSMSFYDKNQVGQLMSRVTNDVSQVQFFLTQGFARLVTTVVTIGAYLIAMLLLDVRLTIVALVVGPGIWYLQRELRTVMPIMRRVQKLNGDLNVLIQEYVSGVKMIQGFGREEHEALRFDEVNRGIRSARMEQQTKMAMVMPGQEFFSNVSLVIILAFGAWQVIEGSMTLGVLSAVSTLALTMWQPVRWFGMINQMSQQAVAAGDRVFEILDTPFDVAERKDAVLIARLQGKIELDHVSFAYGKDRPLLEDISFTAEPGQTIAIVGPSGSGKTTIINLIPRFYDVTAGTVKVDDVDVRDVQLAPLRSQMSMVLQETFLFNMSVRGNIRYGRPEATIEEVEAAAKAAHAHDFILGLSEGYDTMVGERGARLSGGQRQRIAIARALLVDPKILILDEATSSVDAQTDAGIQAALDHLMRNRTTLVIAHRISTVQRADQILVLDGGKIVDRGTHDELLNTSPTYAHLWEMQMHLQAQETGEPLVAAELEVTR